MFWRVFNVLFSWFYKRERKQDGEDPNG